MTQINEHAISIHKNKNFLNVACWNIEGSWGYNREAGENILERDAAVIIEEETSIQNPEYGVPIKGEIPFASKWGLPIGRQELHLQTEHAILI